MVGAAAACVSAFRYQLLRRHWSESPRVSNALGAILLARTVVRTSAECDGLPQDARDWLEGLPSGARGLA